jgi:phage repressor protein C with HTH and peptisase S24 domain
MLPVYHQGDILFFCPNDPDRFVIAKHIGRDCIVSIEEDSSTLLKTVECASQPDLWNLHSHNPEEEVITNQRLHLALPILWVKRRN